MESEEISKTGKVQVEIGTFDYNKRFECSSA